MKATIKHKKTVAKQTDYAEFEVQEGNVDFKPGQYFFVTLNPSDELHKEDLTHHFSIVNAPSQKGILALTTRMRVDRSLFKRTLAAAKEGDEVEIGEIGGSFILPEDTAKPLVFIALGIGITPFVSMLRYIFEEAKPYKVTLIYSDGETDSMPFLEELNQMSGEHASLKLITVVTQDPDWLGEKRHIGGDFVKEQFDDFKDRLYYVSGPPRPVDEVAASLKSAGVPEEAIKTDDFSGY